jgi:hypothetical protein
MYRIAEKENTHVEHIQKIKICTDDDTLNLASVDVTIHEYLIMKTFVLSEHEIIFCFSASTEMSFRRFCPGKLLLFKRK